MENNLPFLFKRKAVMCRARFLFNNPSFNEVPLLVLSVKPRALLQQHMSQLHSLLYLAHEVELNTLLCCSGF